MAYQEFAYFYDEFNGAADYDALFAYVTGELKAHGIQDGIVADFGCGTGELTQKLYDTLTGIQWGKLPDTKGWTVPVDAQ